MLILVHVLPFLLPLCYSFSHGLPCADLRVIQFPSFGERNKKGVDEADVVMSAEAIFKLTLYPNGVS